MVQVKTPTRCHNQLQVNIRCHHFQYITFFGKDNFGAEPMLFHYPDNFLFFPVEFGDRVYQEPSKDQ